MTPASGLTGISAIAFFVLCCSALTTKLMVRALRSGTVGVGRLMLLSLAPLRIRLVAIS